MRTIEFVVTSLLLLFPLCSESAAEMILNEFQPNPAGTDPSTQQFEFMGAAGMSFTGTLYSIEAEDAGTGEIDRKISVSGTFDANGIAVISGADLENPSFTLVFASNDSLNVGTDLDTNNDGLIDDASVFGTVFDALSIIDETSDHAYASQLGGFNFPFVNYPGTSTDEPELVFRGGSGNWFSVLGSNVFDSSGQEVDTALFNLNPTIATFGSANPSITTTPIPEPVTAATFAIGMGLIARRRRV